MGSHPEIPDHDSALNARASNSRNHNLAYEIPYNLRSRYLSLRFVAPARDDGG